MAEELRDRAIVLGIVDYGESDRIVTLLTREHGKIGAFARGGRASRRRFAGALLPFTLLDVRLAPRRGELFGLSSCAIEEAFVGLRDSLEAISLAGYAAELCRELCKEREPHPELFERLRAYLASLASGVVRTEERLAFEMGAVGEAGLAPRLDACVRCEGAPSARLAFDPAAGGILCGRCVDERSSVHLSLGALSLLRQAQLAAPGEWPESPGPEALREALRCARRYLRHVLGKELRSLTVLRQLGWEG